MPVYMKNNSKKVLIETKKKEKRKRNVQYVSLKKC